MSLSAVLQVVETKCAAISGVAAVYRYGRPPGDELPNYPVVVLEIENYDPQNMVMGAATYQEDYDVVINLYLGPKTLEIEKAREYAIPFASRFRRSFAPDWKLLDSNNAATTDNSEFMKGEDNLRVYREAEEEPYLQWVLKVTEYTPSTEAPE